MILILLVNVLIVLLSLLHSEKYEEEQDRDIVRDDPDYR
jgi:hypothetical protein